MNRTRIILLGIILLAFVLRVYKLGQVPPSPDWDEVSLGYNAYSIMLTGRDEYGEFFPVVLRSFDDYKPALYAYFIIPFIKLFGLHLITVRLPSVIFGMLTVIATFFLVKELFRRQGYSIVNRKFSTDVLALFATFFLAISPWHIQFSRIGFESNTGVAFNVFAFLFFLKGLQKPHYIVLSFILAATNIYTYQSEKVFTPLFIAALLFIFRKRIMEIKQWVGVGILTAVIIAIPMIHHTLTNEKALLRAQGVSVFSSDKTNFLKRSAAKIEYDKKIKYFPGAVLDNRRIEYGKAMVSGYLSHFDLNWLFITGDIIRHHAPFMGLLYLYELPLLLIGIYQLIFGNFDKLTKILILTYTLLVPIPASVTTGVPHAVRTLNFLPIPQIFIAIGMLTMTFAISNIKYQISKIKIIYLIFAMCILFFIFNIFYYFNQYFVQLNHFSSQDWQYGYEGAIELVKPIMSSYKKIVVTNEPPWDQSYMFFLYYLQFDPKQYQEQGGTISGGFLQNHKGFLNFTFRPIYWPDEEKDNTLFLGRPSDFPEDAKILKTIHFLNGQPAMKIVEGG